MHGHDHARWQDRLPRLTDAQVSAEIAAALAIYRTAVGTAPAGFAAPGWRCTRASLSAVDTAGFSYRSDTRGTHPYRPAVGNRIFRLPEIPTTLPTLDELYGIVGRHSAALAETIVDALRPGTLNVHTIHAELEGGPHRDVLEALLARVMSVARVVRLCDEVATLEPDALPICGVHDGSVSGRAMPVAVQGPELGPP